MQYIINMIQHRSEEQVYGQKVGENSHQICQNTRYTQTNIFMYILENE